MSSSTVFKENKSFFSKNTEYLNFIKNNPNLLKLDKHLSQFLFNYFQKCDFKPLEYKFKMFVFPGEAYKEPMVKIIYPNDENFDNLKLRDDLEGNFKQYLAKISSDLNEFKIYLKTLHKIRFIVRRN
ncbi:MAG: hypothetical protein ACTSRG_07985 [Candidatus Helarchaeota archaeon]